MALQRGNSRIGIAIGILVMVVAIAGNVFLDWTWANPDGQVLPLVIGVAAAIGGGFVMLQRIRG